MIKEWSAFWGVWAAVMASGDVDRAMWLVGYCTQYTVRINVAIAEGWLGGAA